MFNVFFLLIQINFIGWLDILLADCGRFFFVIWKRLIDDIFSVFGEIRQNKKKIQMERGWKSANINRLEILLGHKS